jgi:hypothetical protein
LIGEAAALACIAIWLPELADSAAVLQLALSTLARELDRQVASEGIDREQSTSYQRFVLDLILQVVALADRNARHLPPPIRDRTTAMAAATRAWIGDGFRAPRIGDADDARGVPFLTDDPWDFRQLLSLAGAVLGDDDTGGCEAALWLGNNPESTPAGSAPLAPAAAPHASRLLSSGYAVLRPPGAAKGTRLLFDCGPLGYRPHASHGHADILSVLVDVGDDEILIDPGTFAYYDEDGRRNAFRATRAHNTVEIGGHDQADAFDPFKWLNIPTTTVHVARLDSAYPYIEASHDGYRRLRPSAIHRRAILCLHAGWLVVDWIEGRGTHSFVRSFHLAPGTNVAALGPGSYRAVARSGRSSLVIRDVVAESDEPSAAELTTAPYSEHYGRSEAAPMLRFLDPGTRLPAVRAVMLAPGSAGDDALRVASATGRRSGEPLEIALIDGRHPLRIRVCSTAGDRVRVSAEGDLGTNYA